MYEQQERRRAGPNKFGWDKQINIANIIAIVGLIATFIRYGNQVVTYLQNVDTKVTVMWTQFVEDHPDKAMMLNTLTNKKD